MASQNESEGVRTSHTGRGLGVVPYNSQEVRRECCKHNNDVRIVMGNTEVGLCEHEKWEQKEERYVRTRQLVTN